MLKSAFDIRQKTHNMIEMSRRNYEYAILNRCDKTITSLVQLKFYFDHFHNDLVYIQSQSLVFAVPANVILTNGDRPSGTQATTKLYMI